MNKLIRIGTRESELALWQANTVRDLLLQNNVQSELILIKSEGDIDLQTPLYEMGVQGIFTKSLDIALIQNKIDIAVHSMKDVPTQLPKGIVQAAVLKRGVVGDLLVYKSKVNREWAIVNSQLSIVNSELSMGESKETDESKIDSPFTTHHSPFTIHNPPFTIATSSIRRKAQWLNRFPNDRIENLRGNVNTRLRKLENENWDAAIFAQAGLERINLRPENSMVLDWMLPAPAQGAVVVVCNENNPEVIEACAKLNDENTAICTKIERDFLRELLGGCSTPISALAEIKGDTIYFRGNILSLDGQQKIKVSMNSPMNSPRLQPGDWDWDLGINAAQELLNKGGKAIAEGIRNATK